MPADALIAPLSAAFLAGMSFLTVVRAKSRKARFYINLALYAGALLTTSALALGVAVALTLVGKGFNTNYYVARIFYHLASPATGLRLRVTNRQNLPVEGEPAILVGNHQSFVDILYLGRMFPKRGAIMAKKELKWMPFLGWWMSLSGTIWINRGNTASALKAMAATAEDIKLQKKSLFIFPEGTRTLSPELTLKPFKKGAFHLAVQSGLPIVPVVCQNYEGLFGKGHFESGECEVRILDPIPTKDLTTADVTSLAERTREVMLAALIEMGNAGKPTARLSNGSAATEGTEVTPLLAPSAAEGAASTSTSTSSSPPTFAEVAASAASRGGARSEGETDDEGVVHVSH